MISVLIAEDNPDKQKTVHALCAELLPSNDINIEVAATITDSGRRLEGKAYDLLILDMQMPQRDGEEARLDAGPRFLRTMYERRRHNLPKYIIGLTSFKDQLAGFELEFDKHNWMVVVYEPNSDVWKDRIARMVYHIIDSRSDDKHFGVDLAIITALEQVELQNILKLPAAWHNRRIEDDPTIYHEGVFSRGGISVSVIAAAALEMGMPASTALSMKMINEFRPRYLAMAGIAAGVKGSYGDILVADVAFDYGSGKLHKHRNELEKKFFPDPHPIPLDMALKARLSRFVSDTSVPEAIRTSVTGGAVPDRLSVHMGPVASGAAVVEDRSVVETIQSMWRKLVGVEMETYGVFLAARFCKEPRPSAMSIKSICDFADPKKADKFQNYAAYTSAAFIHEFALRYLGSDRPATADA